MEPPPEIETIEKPAYTLYRHGSIVEVHFKMAMIVHRSLDALLDACSMYATEPGVKRILFDIREVAIRDTVETKLDFTARAADTGFRATDRLAGLALDEQEGPEIVERGMQALGFQCRLFHSHAAALDWLKRDD